MEGDHSDALSKQQDRLERKNEGDLAQQETQLALKYKKESDQLRASLLEKCQEQSKSLE